MSEPSVFRRQHPLSWVFQALGVVRSAVLPALFFFVFSQGLALGWLAVLLALPAFAIGFVRYLMFDYALADDELVIRDGILNRNERRIRHSRIQNVDEVQGILHRLLGAVAVRIETASGGKAEAALHLTPAAADELRASIFGERSGQDAGPDAALETPVLAVPTGDLVRLGLIRNRGIVLVAAALGLFWQGAWDFGFKPWEVAERAIESRVREGIDTGALAIDLGPLGFVLSAITLVGGFYLLLATLSIALAIVRFAGFTLIRSGDDLTSRFGLLSKLRLTVPRRRIQRLQVDQSLLHRVWRRVSVRLDTAGGKSSGNDGSVNWGEGGGAGGGKQWLAPIAPPARLRELVTTALPRSVATPLEVDQTAAASGWRPISQRTTQRLFNRWSLLVLFITFGLVWVDRWALVLPVVGLPLAWWICRRSAASRFFWATEDALWWRSGWPGRRLVVVPFDKVQCVTLTESPFDRRYDMAGVLIDTAGSGVFHGAHLSHLDATDARELARRLAREADRREFVWT